MSQTKGWIRGGRLKVIPALLAVLALGAAGCGGSDDNDDEGDGAGGDSAPAENVNLEGGTIKMHANFERSGPGALYGVSKFAGVAVAERLINEAGGIQVGDESYDLEVIECDNRTEATYGVRCAQEAVDEGVLWTAAPDIGFEAAYEIYKENDIITIGNGGAASELLTPENIDANPLLTFEFLLYQETVESNLIQLRALYPDVKTIATLLPNDANGQVQDRAYADLASEYGFEVVAQELHPPDAAGDFSSYLTTLKAAKPDAIHLGYYPQVAAAALEQGRDLEAAPLFTADGLTFDDLEGVNFEGVDFLAYQYGWSWFPGFGPDDPEWQEVQAAIEEEAEGEPILPSVATLGMIGDVYMIKEAIEAAGTLDPEAVVAEYTPSLQYDGPFGPATSTERRSVDAARTPFVVNARGEVTAYVFELGLSDTITDELKVPESNRPWAAG
jgi:branched-chain amino acid transport system substrate-binding protein